MLGGMREKEGERGNLLKAENWNTDFTEDHEENEGGMAERQLRLNLVG